MTHCLRNFLQQFTIALAAISSGVTCVAFLYQSNVNCVLNTPDKKVVVLVAIVILCCLYSCFMNHRKSRLAFNVNENFRLVIEKGDIFKKKGVIVVPVNEYFDTHVGDGIISPKSVHGKWINRFYGDRISELDTLIEQKLKSAPVMGTEARNKAKSNRYELGTCIDIDLDGNTYVLIALTHFDEHNHANVSRTEYAGVFDKLMHHLQCMQTESPIYIPLMGTGLSRLGRSPQRILNFLVDAIDFKYSDMTFPNGFNIEIFDMAFVNLTDLDSYIKNGIAL